MPFAKKPGASDAPATHEVGYALTSAMPTRSHPRGFVPGAELSPCSDLYADFCTASMHAAAFAREKGVTPDIIRGFLGDDLDTARLILTGTNKEVTE